MKGERAVRTERAWAMFTPSGWIFHSSVRRTRRGVVEYASNDAAPTWTWAKYRKRGFYIAKVEIRPLPLQETEK
jgi:hypothetical protein